MHKYIKLGINVFACSSHTTIKPKQIYIYDLIIKKIKNEIIMPIKYKILI